VVTSGYVANMAVIPFNPPFSYRLNSPYSRLQGGGNILAVSVSGGLQGGGRGFATNLLKCR